MRAGPFRLRNTMVPQRVMSSLAVLLSLLGVALSRPHIETPFGNFSTKPLSPQDYEWLSRHASTQRVTYPSNFRFVYVAHGGQITETRPASSYIRIIGSPGVAHSALYTSALEVSKMMRHAPSHIFSNLASKSAGVGVFSAQEKLSVFPEYYNVKDTPQCHGRCDGSCSVTCTFDGRKWDETAGAGGLTAVVLIDNVLCTPADPYNHHDNILVHEFSHVVHQYGMSSSEKSQVEAAYNHAKSSHLWTLSAYSMANKLEYFAEATGAYFLVNLQDSPGGMNVCSGRKCTSETAVRAHLHSHDPQLAAILDHIYYNGHPTTPSGLTVCGSSSG